MRLNCRHLTFPLACSCLLLCLLSSLPAWGMPDTDPPAEPAEVHWFTDLEAAAAAAREQDKNLLVDLYADWCGWCKKMDREVFEAAEFQRLARRFILLRVDVEDGADGSDLQQRHGGASLPTTLLLTPRLSKIGMVRGYAPTAVYVERIEHELAQYALQEERIAELLSSDEPDVLLAVAQDLQRRGDGLRAAEVFERLTQNPATERSQIPHMHYDRATALRLGGDYEGALQAIAASRKLAAQNADQALVEANDMLRVQVVRDLGDCQRFKAALHHFLEDHPESRHRPVVQGALQKIDEGRDRACS